MPTPSKGESRSKFASRCIATIRREGDKRPTREVAGQCFGMYDNWKKKQGKKGGKK